MIQCDRKKKNFTEKLQKEGKDRWRKINEVFFLQEINIEMLA